MCTDYTASREEQTEERLGVRSYQLDLRPEAWPGYMALILRCSHAMTCSNLSRSANHFHQPFAQCRPSRPLLIRIVVQHVMPPHLAAY